MTFLRVGLAFVFLYAGIAALGNPDAWSGSFPLWLTGVIVFNLGALDIVFRDVGLFFAALALARS